MSASKCPVMGGAPARGSMANQRWWPHQLNLQVLHQPSPLSDPMGAAFNYAEEFKKLDLAALKQDIEAVMTTSQDWWPADYGHYGPLFIRMAWHSAGTYRIGDGRGGASSGTLRFAPLNSWPDNANLDKARRLLWPIKQKYGRKISWADLMILAGNVRPGVDGVPDASVLAAGGRRRLGARRGHFLGVRDPRGWRTSATSGDRQLEQSFRRCSDGPDLRESGRDPTESPGSSSLRPRDIRETFARMAMNDEETVALIAGGHTFGKTHGAADPNQYVGPEPEAASIEEQGLGWKSTLWQRQWPARRSASGLEGAWTTTPVKWSNNGYLENLFGYEWELGRRARPARTQWVPNGGADAAGTVPDVAGSVEAARPGDAHDGPLPERWTRSMRLSAKRFLENPQELRGRVRQGVV